MKPNPHSDPLDQKIDALLASRPLKPSNDFAARVLAAAEAEMAVPTPKNKLGNLIKFTLPLAAAIALTFSLLQFNPATQPTTAPEDTSTLSSTEAQEIFLLEESLSSIAIISTSDLSSHNLLNTLDALYLEI
jgi:hypothetical protein